MEQPWQKQASACSVLLDLYEGEPIAEDNDLFGTAVTLAPRIIGKAINGEVLVSDVILQLVAGKRFNFEDRGVRHLRGLETVVGVGPGRQAASGQPG